MDLCKMNAHLGMQSMFQGMLRCGIKIVSMLLLLGGVLLIANGCTQTEPQSYSETGFALGTTCSIKIYGKEYKELLGPAIAIASDVEEKMSAHTENSEVAAINKNAGLRPVEVSSETFQLINRAKQFSSIGDGIFDVSVGPLVELWDIGSGEEKVPSRKEIDKVLEKVNYNNVVLLTGSQTQSQTQSKTQSEKQGVSKEQTEEKSKVFLEKPGMKIDLGAIAKGYAADQIMEYLTSKGVGYGIVNLGGNVYAFGKKFSSSEWKIGIQSPEDERGRYIGILQLVDKAVVTSGKYERYFVEDGVRYHHILSTKDGFPVENGIASVSIISSDATEADALSTLVFGFGLEKGLRFTEEREGVEAIFVTEENTVFTTSGLRSSFKLTDKNFRRGESKEVLNGD